MTRRRVVIADANVLINLLHVGRLDLCGAIPDLEFVVPENVQQEVSRPEHQSALARAVESGNLRIESVTGVASLTLYAELTARMGRGEAACLALAVATGWDIASDEKGRFRREVESRRGTGRLLGTVDLIVLAIKSGLMTVEEADLDKKTLEARRFKVSFGSFRELI